MKLLSSLACAATLAGLALAIPTPLDPASLLTLLLGTTNAADLTALQIGQLCVLVGFDGSQSLISIEGTIANALPLGTLVAPLEPIIDAISARLLAECPVSTTSTTMSSTTSSSSSSSSSSSVVTTSSTTSSTVTSSSSLTGTSTTGSSSSVSSTASSATGSPTGSSFVLQVGGGSSKKLRSRQGGARGYIGADGSIVGSCASAASFSLTTSGQLSGGGGLVSTDGTAANALFVAVNPALRISTSFSGNPLAWTNTAFTGGAAQFCTVNNQVYSVFRTAPTGCVDVSLFEVSVGSCTDINNGNGDTTNNNNTTINNTSIKGDTYNVNGDIYNNSGNNQVNVDGDNNNVNAGEDNSIKAGQQVSVKSILPADVYAAFEDNSANYYCSDDYYYYAKFCSTCAIIPVQKNSADLSKSVYIDTSGATICVPGYDVTHLESATPCSGQSSAQIGIVVYQSSYCVSSCGSQSITTLDCSVTTISSVAHLVASTTSGAAVITTTLACDECESSSIGVICPTVYVTQGAVLTAGSQTVTITPAPTYPAGAATGTTYVVPTSPVPFTGAANKKSTASGLFLAMFGFFLL